MTIEIFASSSDGNCSYIEKPSTNIIIDCGLKIQDMKRCLNHSLSSIDGCLISHSHKDHCKSAKHLLQHGVNIYCTRETADEIGIQGHRVRIIEPSKSFSLKDWTIKPFKLKHDVMNVGFLMQYKNEEKGIYITDTPYTSYKFPALDFIIIECNYVLKDFDQSNINSYLKKRIISNHMSMESLVKMLKNNNLSRLKEIHLIHLSSTNSHENKIKSEIQSITGIPVYVAKEKVT